MFKSRRKLAAQLKAERKNVERLKDTILRLNYLLTKATQSMDYIRTRTGVSGEYVMSHEDQYTIAELIRERESK